MDGAKIPSVSVMACKAATRVREGDKVKAIAAVDRTKTILSSTVFSSLETIEEI
jgi:hypothetical protein